MIITPHSKAVLIQITASRTVTRTSRLSAQYSAGFWPTIATALRAKHHWVQILCEGCGGVTDLDLRVKPRDPEASVRVALRDVRCPRCNGHGRPRIVGLAAHPSI